MALSHAKPGQAASNGPLATSTEQPDAGGSGAGGGAAGCGAGSGDEPPPPPQAPSKITSVATALRTEGVPLSIGVSWFAFGRRGLMMGCTKFQMKMRRKSPAREYSTGTTNSVTKVDIAKPQPTANEMMLTIGS